MNNFLNIQETYLDPTDSTLHITSIKITNTSTHFINNLKLSINSCNPLILEPTIIRERGSLHYDKDTCFFELGNLAPQESALFEYKSATSPLSLLEHITLLFTPEDANSEIIQPISSLND